MPEGATNGIVATGYYLSPSRPINTSGSDDDEENQLSNDRTPLQRINATYKKQIRFQQNYNAGLPTGSLSRAGQFAANLVSVGSIMTHTTSRVLTL